VYIWIKCKPYKVPMFFSELKELLLGISIVFDGSKNAWRWLNISSFSVGAKHLVATRGFCLFRSMGKCLIVISHVCPIRWVEKCPVATICVINLDECKMPRSLKGFFSVLVGEKRLGDY